MSSYMQPPVDRASVPITHKDVVPAVLPLSGEIQVLEGETDPFAWGSLNAPLANPPVGVAMRVAG